MHALISAPAAAAAHNGAPPRGGSALLKPPRQVIESVTRTFRAQLDLERHQGRTSGGVMATFGFGFGPTGE
ncbi:hypothetical protein ACIGBL_31230 [Streptomyces sp. NPDC085614]|uniref:hypothetical protein n=1 Tax=Streptomyces sp. NPDC085614 TaxID=3365733 RepID=UPI0037D78168